MHGYMLDLKQSRTSFDFCGKGVGVGIVNASALGIRVFQSTFSSLFTVDLAKQSSFLICYRLEL